MICWSALAVVVVPALDVPLITTILPYSIADALLSPHVQRAPACHIIRRLNRPGKGGGSRPRRMEPCQTTHQDPNVGTRPSFESGQSEWTSKQLTMPGSGTVWSPESPSNWGSEQNPSGTGSAKQRWIGMSGEEQRP